MEPEVAIYTVHFVRELGDSDGTNLYHDGTGEDACRQLADEIDEALEMSGAVDGFFVVSSRHLATWKVWDTLKSTQYTKEDDYGR